MASDQKTDYNRMLLDAILDALSEGNEVEFRQPAPGDTDTLRLTLTRRTNEDKTCVARHVPILGENSDILAVAVQIDNAAGDLNKHQRS